MQKVQLASRCLKIWPRPQGNLSGCFLQMPNILKLITCQSSSGWRSTGVHITHHAHTGAAAAGHLQPRPGGQLPAGRGRGRGRGHGADGPLAHCRQCGGVQAAALRPGDGEAPLLTQYTVTHPCPAPGQLRAGPLLPRQPRLHHHLPGRHLPGGAVCLGVRGARPQVSRTK